MAGCQLFLLAAGLCLVAGACRSSDPADQLLDRLEQSVVNLEKSVAGAQSRPAERLTAEMVKALGDSGALVQKAYAEVQLAGSDGLSTDQGKRRTELTERAVNAVSDMLNLRLSDEKK
jgi:hypothetical protein